MFLFVRVLVLVMLVFCLISINTQLEELQTLLKRIEVLQYGSVESDVLVEEEVDYVSNICERRKASVSGRSGGTSGSQQTGNAADSVAVSSPALKTVQFYDKDQNIVDAEALRYNAARMETSLLFWTQKS